MQDPVEGDPTESDLVEGDTVHAKGRMSLIEHLAELRRRVIVSLVAVVLGSIVAFIFFGRILDFLIEPYRDITGNESLIFTDPLEAFTTRLKVAGYGGLVLASPVVFWQFWRFITPGLYPREKRYAIPFVASSVLLFLFGAFVAVRTFPQALDFLLTIGGEELTPLLTAGRYLSLVTLMVVAFGLAFEFPVVLLFLLLARVVTTAQLRRIRRWVVIGVVVFAAVITPSGDPYSQLFMAVPMYLFFEIVIIIGRIMRR